MFENCVGGESSTSTGGGIGSNQLGSGSGLQALAVPFSSIMKVHTASGARELGWHHGVYVGVGNSTTISSSVNASIAKPSVSNVSTANSITTNSTSSLVHGSLSTPIAGSGSPPFAGAVAGATLVRSAVLALTESEGDAMLGISNSIGEGNVAEIEQKVTISHLSFPCARPVVGCSLRPHVIQKEMDGKLTIIEKGANANNNGATPGMLIAWFRAKKHLCAANCGKIGSIQCLMCVKSGLEKLSEKEKGSYFCSMKCYSECFAAHQKLHGNIKQREWFDDDGDEDEELEVKKFKKGEVASEKELVFCKFPSKALETWSLISEEMIYTPTQADIGCALRFEITPPKADGFTFYHELASTFDIPEPISKRRMIKFGSSSSSVFRVVCYNVLAEIYASRQIYPYCESWALQWDYRRILLMNEIQRYEGDIVCLQEVQIDHYENTFKPKMGELGYEGLFKPKTRDDNPTAIDGSAIFYRKSKFVLKDQYSIEYNEAARQHVEYGTFAADKKAILRRLLKGNVALIAVLEEVQPSHASHRTPRSLCVVNTHLYWDSQFEDVKLWQTLVLCQELEKMMTDRYLPLLVCGDFNSLPDSAVYALLTPPRHVSYSHKVFELDQLSLLPPISKITHNFPFASAYAKVLKSEPLYTNFTGHFKGVLDYMFFTESNLRVTGILEIDDEAKLVRNVALPSPFYPSDHLAIVADFDFV